MPACDRKTDRQIHNRLLSYDQTIFSNWWPSAILNFKKMSYLIIRLSSRPKLAVVYQTSSKSDEFYRATRRLMHSADYPVARCLSVSLSVSHMPVFCRNGYNISSHFFHHKVASQFWFFRTISQYSDNDPPNWGVK